MLEDVYAELGLDWDPATTGSVANEAPGIGVADVRGALLAEYGQDAALMPPPRSSPTSSPRPVSLVPRYRV